MTSTLEALHDASGGAQAHTHELEAKYNRVRSSLEQGGYDAVLLRRHENLAWVSAGQMEARVGILRETGVLALLLLRDGRRFALAPNNEALRMADEELAGLGYELVVRPWHSLDLEAEARAIAGDKVATDASLGSLPVLDLGGLRAPLFPSEMARFRILGQQSAEAVTDALLAVQPGRSERELEASVAERLLPQGIFPSVLLMAADERILRYKHAVARGGHVQRFAMLNLCTRRWGLAASITRFVHFGKLPPELARGFAVAAGVNAALQHATRDGATAGTLFQAAADAYASLGFAGEEQLHHQGGACGYLEREWVAAPGRAQQVREPQAFAWNPSCRGGKVEDTTLITSGGVEVLTRTPRLPEVDTEVGGSRYTSAAILLRD